MPTATLDLDAAKAEAFAGSMLDTLNRAGLAFMLSVGHRTGLFDALQEMPPATTEEIARRAGLNERYVREWCGALTTGGVLQYDSMRSTYRLPAEHAQFLSRRDPANNMAALMQYFAVLGGVEDRIVECFRQGGGVPYEAYSRFHDVMAEDSGQTVVPMIIEHILPLAPGVPEALERGIDVLDAGCGQGRAVRLMAEAYPRSRFFGYDLSEQAIASATRAAADLTNVHFEVRDLTRFPIKRSMDLVTAFDAIHDQARPDLVLAGIAQVLRPGGTFIMQDIAVSSNVEKNLEHPVAPLIYTISAMHCMTVSLAQGGLGLGAAWGEEKALEMLRAAGFRKIEVTRLPHDFMNQYYVATKD